MNKTLNLAITDYDVEDLEETAFSIAKALDEELTNRYKEYFEILAKTYFDYYQSCQYLIQENKDFHGNRDFYYLIKIAMWKLIEKKMYY